MGKEWCVIHRSRRWIGKRPCRWLPKGSGLFYVLTSRRRYGMAFRPFKGICLVSVRPHHFGGAVAPAQEVESREWPDMRRVKREDRASVKHLVPLETEAFRDLMPLVEHCGMLQYEDAEPRQPGWFTIRTNGAAWQCVVKDPDSASSVTCSAKTLDEALSMAALLLGCEEAPWEPDAWLAKAKQSKKSK